MLAIVERTKKEMPDGGKWSVLVALSKDDNTGVWTGEAINGEGKPVTVTYDEDTGLQTEPKK